jgi:hypothetical protein
VEKMLRQSGNLFSRQDTVWEIAQTVEKIAQTVWKLVYQARYSLGNSTDSGENAQTVWKLV